MLYLFIVVGVAAFALMLFLLAIAGGLGAYLFSTREKPHAIATAPPHPVPTKRPDAPVVVTQRETPCQPPAQPPPKPYVEERPPHVSTEPTITYWQPLPLFDTFMNVSMWIFFACLALWFLSVAAVGHEWYASEFAVMTILFGFGQFYATIAPEILAGGLPRTWLTLPFIWMGYIGSPLAFIGAMLLVHFIYMAPHHVRPVEYIGYGWTAVLLAPLCFMMGHLLLRATLIKWHAKRVIAKAEGW